MKRITSALILSILLCEGCVSSGYKKDRLAFANGWKMLDFPREKLLPGTVFSSDAQNEFLICGNFASTNDTVRESITIPDTEFSLNKEANMKAAVSFLASGTTVSISPFMTNTTEGNITLKTVGAESFRLNNLLDTLPSIAKEIQPKMSRDTRGQKFYVVVESVAVSQIEYKFDDKGFRSLGGDAGFGKIVSANALLSTKSSESRSINEKFSPPHFIMFQARKLALVTAGVDGGGKLVDKMLDENDLPQLLSR